MDNLARELLIQFPHQRYEMDNRHRFMVMKMQERDYRVFHFTAGEERVEVLAREFDSRRLVQYWLKDNFHVTTMTYDKYSSGGDDPILWSHWKLFRDCFNKGMFPNYSGLHRVDSFSIH